MALATTCPRCKTSFRVVPDQLKLRRGFVRCGRCRNVFAGIDHLRYVDDGQLRDGQVHDGQLRSGAEAATSEADLPLVVDADDGSTDPRFAYPDTDTDTDTDGNTATDAGDGGPDAAAHAHANEGEDEATDEAANKAEVEDAHAPADADVEYVVVDAPPHDPLAREPLATEEPADEAAHIEDAHAHEAGRNETGVDTTRPEEASPDETTRDQTRSDAPCDDGSSPDDTPDGRADEAPAWLERYASSAAADTVPANDDAAARFAPPDAFGDEAEGESAIDYFSTRRSRGFADRRGIVAAFVALALVIALVLQLVVAERATIAARAPGLAPILAAVLAPFGLDIGAPSELDALTIESFELQASEAPDVLEMRALLRNHADHPVRWPSMQLTLTDRSDRVLVRRTLDPGDYLRDAGTTPDEGLPAQTEWPLHLALEARDLHLAGYDYRVRLFYP